MSLEVVERLKLLVISCEGLRVGLADGGDGSELKDLSGKGNELGRCGRSRDQGILRKEGTLGFAEKAIGSVQLLVLESVVKLRDDGLEFGHGVQMYRKGGKGIKRGYAI